MRKSQYTLFMFAIFANNWIENIQTVNNDEAHKAIKMDDLYDLTSLIYNESNKELNPKRIGENHPRLTTFSPAKHFLNNDKKKKSHETQKATLSDVLMMKLISYYEDKYKVADHEPTETGTKIPVLSGNDILYGGSKDALNIGSGTENFKKYTNMKDVPEVVVI